MISLCQFLLHICIVILLMLHLFIFCDISTVVFLVNNSGGIFLLRVLGSARCFPAVQNTCKFGNFIKNS